MYFLLQSDQLNTAVYFWYFVKSDLSSVQMYSSAHWASHLLHGTRKTRPCLSGRVVSYSADLALLSTTKKVQTLGQTGIASCKSIIHYMVVISSFLTVPTLPVVTDHEDPLHWLGGNCLGNTGLSVRESPLTTRVVYPNFDFDLFISNKFFQVKSFAKIVNGLSVSKLIQLLNGDLLFS